MVFKKLIHWQDIGARGLRLQHARSKARLTWISGRQEFQAMPDEQAYVRTLATHQECIHASYFFDFYDEEFLIEVYAKLLRRAPDPVGLNTYLSLIRSGESRYRILHSISRSPEAGAIGVRVFGMKPYRRMRAIRHIPVLGKLLDSVLFIWNAGDVMRDLRALENHMYRVSKKTAI